MAIPSRHHALIYDNPGTLSVRAVEVETPAPGPGQVLIRLSHSGVCHSDYAVMINNWKWLPDLSTKDQVGGREGVGEIVKLGPGLDSDTVQLGDRVGIKWFSSVCLHCPACMVGLEGSCFRPTVSGYSVPGTFQEYVLAPANYVTPIPADLPSDVAAPLLCGGLTVYSAFLKTPARAGEWFVVSGAGGGLGHLACEIGSRGLGFRILGIDSVEKEALVKECGAEQFIPINKYPRGPEGDTAMADDVKRITVGGAAGVMVCTAAHAAYAQALNFLRSNGTLVCVGITEGNEVPIQSADPGKLIIGQLNITASSVGNRKEALDVLHLAARGVVKPKFSLHKPKELESVFSRMAKGELLGRAVIALDSEQWE